MMSSQLVQKVQTNGRPVMAVHSSPKVDLVEVAVLGEQRRAADAVREPESSAVVRMSLTCRGV